MARRRARERTVFLPWERQGSLLRRAGVSRVRSIAIGLVVASILLGLVVHERRRAAERSTRATLLVARRGIDSFRADHDGACPKGGLEEVVASGYLPRVPVDAWKQPLRLVCPARRA